MENIAQKTCVMTIMNIYFNPALKFALKRIFDKQYDSKIKLFKTYKGIKINTKLYLKKPKKDK